MTMPVFGSRSEQAHSTAMSTVVRQRSWGKRPKRKLIVLIEPRVFLSITAHGYHGAFPTVVSSSSAAVRIFCASSCGDSASMPILDRRRAVAATSAAAVAERAPSLHCPCCLCRPRPRPRPRARDRDRTSTHSPLRSTSGSAPTSELMARSSRGESAANNSKSPNNGIHTHIPFFFSSFLWSMCRLKRHTH